MYMAKKKQTGPIIKPLQKRSEDAANRTLDALNSLLKLRSIEAISMQEIAREADVSVSSIYARFRDKKAMIFALHLRVMDQAIALYHNISSIDNSSKTLEEVVTEILSRYLLFARKNQHVLRAAALSDEPLAQQRIVEQIRFVSRLCIEHVKARKPGLDEDVFKEIDMTVRVIAATLQQTWIMNEPNPSAFEYDDNELAARLARMASRYIQLDSFTVG